MANSSWNLEKVKKYLDNFVENKNDYYMIVTNKETQKEGCAIITQNKKIAVFEGKDDGSEDRIYSQKEFKAKYKIENIYSDRSTVKIADIEEDLCDLDTEYREALAKCLVQLKYISDTPLKLKYGTEKQQKELERVWNKPLKAKQINEIIIRYYGRNERRLPVRSIFKNCIKIFKYCKRIKKRRRKESKKSDGG